MKKSYLAALIAILFLATLSSQFARAEIKLLCIDENENVEFSKCNFLMQDRTCTSSAGCQYCVDEIRSGIYCPKNINSCNIEGLTCTSLEETPIVPEQIEDDDIQNTNAENTQPNNQNTSQTNTQTSNQNINQTNQSVSQNNTIQSSLKRFISGLKRKVGRNLESQNKTDQEFSLNETKNESEKKQSIITGFTTNETVTITISKKTLAALMLIPTIIEIIVLIFLLNYMNKKEKNKRRK